MEKLFNGISVLISAVGGGLAYIFGGWDMLLWTLLVFIVLDYITGILKGIYTKTLSSGTSFKGLLKKIEILILVVVANTVQRLLGDSVPVREIVITFYIANEGISILENAAVILPDMPPQLKDFLLQIRKE